MARQPDFCYGFILGFLIAGVLGFTLTKIRAARDTMGSPYRPMTVKTQKTPRQVMDEAAGARLSCILWTIFGIASILISLALLRAILF